MEAELKGFALSPEQTDTVALLDRLFGRAIANRYTDFCQLAASATGLRVTRPLAAHALRELESMLRSSLEVPMDAKAQPVKDAQRATAEAALKALDYDVAAIQRALGALAPRLNHASQIRLIAERLGLAAESDVVRAWVSLCEMFGKAHERSFHRSLDVDDEFRQTFQQPFELVLRSVVVALQKRYSALMQRVEQIAAMSDYSGAIRIYEKEIPGALPLQWHFFQTIESTHWLAHLLERELTGEPLAAIDGAGTNQFREWPVGHYLLKIAKGTDAHAQRLVATAIRKVAQSKHPDVRHQSLEIMAALPPAETVQLLDVAVGWLDPDERNLYQTAPVEMIKRLAVAGFSSEAVSLARSVFQIFDRGGNVASLHPEHMYEHYLPEAVKVLAAADGLAALKLFSNLLIESQIIARHFGDGAPDDYTYMTPHPLSDSQMATYSISDALVIAVRDTALAVCAKGAKHVVGGVNLLLEFPAKIFKRISMHVLSKHANAAPELSAALLMDTNLIGESWCEDEYAELAVARFSSMTSGEQEKILKVIDAYPDEYRAAWAERFENHQQRLPGKADIRAFDLCVVRDAVWKWREALPKRRREEVEEVGREFGDPDDWKNRLFAEEVSPLTGSDFTSQPIPTVIAFLNAWKPEAEPARHTMSALGQQLRSAVEGETLRFMDVADQFDSLRPIYVRRLLEGLDSKVRNGGFYSWGPSLKLLRSIMDRLIKPKNEFPPLEGDDASWIWSASAAATLLKSSLRHGAQGIPYQYAPQVLAIIQSLFKYAPRQPDAKDFEESFSRHPYFAAEQCMWGSAVELAVLFVFWSSKHEASAIFQSPRSAIELIPEIAQLFEAALSDVTSTGRIPRAILGRYLNWLGYFGESWARSHIREIFSENEVSLRRAAWLGHLLNDNRPAQSLAKELLPNYLDEIERLAAPEETREREQRERRLGEYTIILHLAGTAPDELIRAFLGKAPARARAHAMSFLGRELALPPERIEEKFRTRGMKYWEDRLTSAIAANNPDAYEIELGVVGQWCAKDHINTPWLLDQLSRMLSAGFTLTTGYTVVDWLGKIAPDHPDKAVEVLNALVTNPKVNQWTYATHRDSMRVVLKIGLAQGSAAIADRVRELISHLATIGESSYLDLLRPTADLTPS
jgi:hypothetical protein